MARVRLVDFCHSRSGDKGKNCNIGLITWQPEHYPIIAREVTAERVKEHFGDLVRGRVHRFELPNLQALNFILEDSLDGGGLRSLRLDPQGKAMCEALLLMEIEVDENLARSMPGRRLL